MMQNVPKADVVVTNPTHFAVALRYHGDEMPPLRWSPRAQDLIAQRIRQIAREHSVPVVENKPLARALYAASEMGPGRSRATSSRASPRSWPTSTR